MLPILSLCFICVSLHNSVRILTRQHQMEALAEGGANSARLCFGVGRLNKVLQQQLSTSSTGCPRPASSMVQRTRTLICRLNVTGRGSQQALAVANARARPCADVRHAVHGNPQPITWSGQSRLLNCTQYR